MCGIVGIININREPINIKTLSKMMKAQAHRGPDDQGLVAFSLSQGTYQRIGANLKANQMSFEGGIGFNRLSILDLTSHGHQPMVSYDGKVLIAFNGEIYNAFDLRPMLEKKGFKFHSKTDTEVILNLYLAFGQEKMLSMLNGMFAICMIDLRQRRITLARDRLGIKPMYICLLGQQILFASEAKAFLYHPRFKIDLDPFALNEYLTFRYCAQNRNLLSKVEQIEPGQWLEITLNGIVSKKSYWTIPDMENCHTRLSLKQAVNQLHECLESSVKRRLLSDVKLGCQLSGGIDSTLVNIFAAKNAKDNIEAFSVTFNDSTLSEKPWIEKASQYTNMVSHCYELNSSYFVENIRKASWHLDQPINHPNSLGLMFLAENASKKVKVLLSGEGADELLGGYSRYYFAKLRPWVKPIIPILNQGLFNHMSGYLQHFGLTQEPVEHFIMSSAFVNRECAKKLYADYNYNAVLSMRETLFLGGKSTNHISNCLRYDMQTYLVDLLIRQDKMTMAFSVENRVPFLDHELVEFVRLNLAISHLVFLFPSYDPKQWITKGTKVILKALMSRYFDNSFVFRKKAGFAIPLINFFQNPSFRILVQDEILPGIKIRGILEIEYIKNLWANVDRLGKFELESLWVSLALELWLQEIENAQRRN